MISHTADAVVFRPKWASHFSSQGPSALVSSRIQRVRKPERPALQSPTPHPPISNSCRRSSLSEHARKYSYAVMDCLMADAPRASGTPGPKEHVARRSLTEKLAGGQGRRPKPRGLPSLQLGRVIRQRHDLVEDSTIVAPKFAPIQIGDGLGEPGDPPVAKRQNISAFSPRFTPSTSLSIDSSNRHDRFVSFYWE